MRNVIIAAVAALVTGVVTIACGGNSNLCEANKVRCESPLSCDPQDGVCKCGGMGGVACAEGFICDAESTTCLSNRCAGVSCGRTDQTGYDCDRLDGACKCGGTGGVVCGEGEMCNPATKNCQPARSCTDLSCLRNQACDPETVRCVCGTEQCELSQACSIAADQTKVCAADLCSGVACVGQTACDPADGRCKCNGTACQSGEVCACPAGADAGTCADDQRTCRSGSACANVVCGGGTTCDPGDGQCKCGGPGGPVCGVDQVCALDKLQCQGGNQCQLTDGGTKACSGGTSCDPEDGLCKCGGRGGQVCSDGSGGVQAEVCVQTLFSQTCRPRCDVRFQDCSPGTYCYWDTTAKTPTAYCSVSSDSKTAGQGCTNPTACFTITPKPEGMFCNGLGTFDQPGSTGFCRAYCDTQTQNCSQAQFPQKCSVIPGSPAGWGFCEAT